MSRAIVARMAVTTAGAVGALALAAGPAAASCAPPQPMEQAIADARQVFVGTVEALADEDHRATVRVEEVWKGPDVPPVTEVHGSPGGPGGLQARSSVDRTYAAGARYLFVLYDDSAPYEDNICTRTSEWSEDFAQYRPADWRHPVSAPANGAPGEGEMGVTSTTGGESDSEEPTMVGANPDEPISYGPDGQTAEELADDSGLVEGEPVATRGGLDSRLLLGMVVGVIALAAAGWWLRRA